MKLQKCKNIRIIDGKPVCMTKEGQAQPRACSTGEKSCYQKEKMKKTQNEFGFEEGGEESANDNF